MFTGIDLSSDTVTKPTQAMKAAMIAAPLGDEQKDEDPTTRLLEQRVAEQLAVADAVFLPSATMANEIALLLLAEPGSEVFAADSAHIFMAESGAPAMLARIMCKPISTTQGLFTREQMLSTYHQVHSPYRPKPTLISIENTTNLGGGFVWPTQMLNDILVTANSLHLKKHLDGARLCNASVASNTTLAELAQGFDTITLCFSKGLGCPVGAVLALRDASFRPLARHYKHMLGGSMRQSGILSAACLYALEHHVTRLADDHHHATMLAEGLQAFDKSLHCVNATPQTNIVIFDWIDKTTSADVFYQNCLDSGVRFSRISPTRFRAVTHLDIQPKAIQDTLNSLSKLLSH